MSFIIVTYGYKENTPLYNNKESKVFSINCQTSPLLDAMRLKAAEDLTKTLKEKDKLYTDKLKKLEQSELKQNTSLEKVEVKLEEERRKQEEEARKEEEEGKKEDPTGKKKAPVVAKKDVKGGKGGKGKADADTVEGKLEADKEEIINKIQGIKTEVEAYTKKLEVVKESKIRMLEEGN